MNTAYPLNQVSELYEGMSKIDVVIFLHSRKLHFSIELSGRLISLTSYIYFTFEIVDE